jgi:hypothetical protein
MQAALDPPLAGRTKARLLGWSNGAISQPAICHTLHRHLLFPLQAANSTLTQQSCQQLLRCAWVSITYPSAPFTPSPCHLAFLHLLPPLFPQPPQSPPPTPTHAPDREHPVMDCMSVLLGSCGPMYIRNTFGMQPTTGTRPCHNSAWALTFHPESCQ